MQEKETTTTTKRKKKMVMVMVLVRKTMIKKEEEKKEKQRKGEVRWCLAIGEMESDDERREICSARPPTRQRRRKMKHPLEEDTKDGVPTCVWIILVAFGVNLETNCSEATKSEPGRVRRPTTSEWNVPLITRGDMLPHSGGILCAYDSSPVCRSMYDSACST